MNQQPEHCPDCGAGTLRLEEYSDQFEYQGRQLTVDGLQCLVCDHCDAEIIRPEQIRHGDRLYADARRRADGLLTGREIADLRKNLGLTQRQAAELFGGGPNAFSKYERGDINQSVAMDRLMRLVVRFPALMGSLAMDAGIDDAVASGQLAYTHVADLSLNDASFRSRQLRETVISVETSEWRKTG
ncbi:MAG: type II toxin-antitoxin system MqsA family antitoxin [Wenzhouxiangellaceae bacterium]